MCFFLNESEFYAGRSRIIIFLENLWILSSISTIPIIVSMHTNHTSGNR